MLCRLAKRVFRLITCRSRKLSIGGLVTWLKFWRKKWLIVRGLSEMTASGVSSPIDPIASFASSTMGLRISSISSSVRLAATCRRVSSALSQAGSALGASARSSTVRKSLINSP